MANAIVVAAVNGGAGGSYTVKGPRHFQFSATRDDVIIECATLLAVMGRYTRRQERCKESGSPRGKGVATRGAKIARSTESPGEREGHSHVDKQVNGVTELVS